MTPAEATTPSQATTAEARPATDPAEGTAYAMQYEIPLPADYDMGIIRHRVATRGHATDGFPGLALKAYLVRDRASGAASNAYAPFYVWHEVGGMRRFLWGGAGFDAIVRDFGRPAVRHWTVAGLAPGPARDGDPRWALLATGTLPAGAAPHEAVPAAVADLRRRVTPATHTQVLAVDPVTWTTCSLSLLTAEPDGPVAEPDGVEGTAYEVAHLSWPASPPASLR